MYRKLTREVPELCSKGLSGAMKSNIAKGSFGPTFAGDPAEEGNEQGCPPQPRENKRKRTIKCKACNQGHDVGDCYYLFPEKAPKEFKARDHVRSRVEEKLKQDEP